MEVTQVSDGIGVDIRIDLSNWNYAVHSHTLNEFNKNWLTYIGFLYNNLTFGIETYILAWQVNFSSTINYIVNRIGLK